MEDLILIPTIRKVHLSIKHVLTVRFIQTSDKGNVQCPESETLINQPSQLVKTIVNLMDINNVTPEYEIDLTSDLIAKNVDILEENIILILKIWKMKTWQLKIRKMYLKITIMKMLLHISLSL